MKAFRIVLPDHVAEAYSGEGAALTGGRWHEVGDRMVYAWDYLPAEPICPKGKENEPALHACVVAHIPSSLIHDIEDFSPTWNNDITKKCGHEWFLSQSSVGLRVPSAIQNGPSIILLNPLHPDFGSVTYDGPVSTMFDPFLKYQLRAIPPKSNVSLAP